MCKCKSLQAGQLSQEHFHYHKTSEARSWWQLKPVVEIIVGHLSWPTRFPIWPSNVFEMVEEMNRKNFVHWILSLHTTKLYDPKLIHFAWLIINRLKRLSQASQNNSFCHHCKCSYNVPFITSFTIKQSICEFVSLLLVYFYK